MPSDQYPMGALELRNGCLIHTAIRSERARGSDPARRAEPDATVASTRVALAGFPIVQP